MKKTKYTLLVLLLVACVTGCIQDRTLNKVFTRKEMKTVNRIIDYYDEYVRSHTSHDIPIEEAYRMFLEKNCYPKPKDYFSDPEDFRTPSEEEKNHLLQSLDRDAFSCLYYIRDSFYLYPFDSEKPAQAFYRRNTLELRQDSKYFELLKLLGSRSPFYAVFYNYIRYQPDHEISRTICVHTGKIYRKDYPPSQDPSYPVYFDFSKKEERLICILPLLFENKGIDVPSQFSLAFERKTEPK